MARCEPWWIKAGVPLLQKTAYGGFIFYKKKQNYFGILASFARAF